MTDMVDPSEARDDECHTLVNQPVARECLQTGCRCAAKDAEIEELREALEAWRFCFPSLTVADDDVEGANRVVRAASLTERALAGAQHTPDPKDPS